MPGLQLLDNATVRLDGDEPQPDALLRRQVGGGSRIIADDYVEGGPELIVEIAASSASLDLHEKLRVYRRNGVREYLVWRVYDGELDWFALQEGRYEPLAADEAGIIIRSEVYPGLWLAKAALLSRDLAAVLAVQQQGLAAASEA